MLTWMIVGLVVLAVVFAARAARITQHALGEIVTVDLQYMAVCQCGLQVWGTTPSQVFDAHLRHLDAVSRWRMR